MRLLALDIATATGWGRWDRTLNRPHAGELKLQAKDEAGRYAEFDRWLRATIVANSIDLLAFEEPVPQRTGKTNLNTLLILHGLRTVALLVGKKLNIPMVEVNTQEWRAHFIGQRIAPKTVPVAKRSDWWKKQSIQRCEQLGWAVKSHNAADALGILDFVRARFDRSYGATSGDLFRGAA